MKFCNSLSHDILGAKNKSMFNNGSQFIVLKGKNETIVQYLFI